MCALNSIMENNLLVKIVPAKINEKCSSLFKLKPRYVIIHGPVDCQNILVIARVENNSVARCSADLTQLGSAASCDVKCLFTSLSRIASAPPNHCMMNKKISSDDTRFFLPLNGKRRLEKKNHLSSAPQRW